MVFLYNKIKYTYSYKKKGPHCNVRFFFWSNSEYTLKHENVVPIPNWLWEAKHIKLTLLFWSKQNIAIYAQKYSTTVQNRREVNLKVQLYSFGDISVLETFQCWWIFSLSDISVWWHFSFSDIFCFGDLLVLVTF